MKNHTESNRPKGEGLIILLAVSLITIFGLFWDPGDEGSLQVFQTDLQANLSPAAQKTTTTAKQLTKLDPELASNGDCGPYFYIVLRPISEDPQIGFSIGDEKKQLLFFKKAVTVFVDKHFSSPTAEVRADGDNVILKMDLQTYREAKCLPEPSPTIWTNLY